MYEQNPQQNGYQQQPGYQQNPYQVGQGGYQQGGYNQGGYNNQLPPKPDSYLWLAILTTVCCCLPCGIYAIVKSAGVGSAYNAGMYDLAVASAEEAKKWSLIGIGIGVAINVIYFVACFAIGLAPFAFM